MEMGKEVWVSVCGRQSAGGEKTKTRTAGEHYRRGNSRFFLYEERLEGETQPVKNVLRLSGDEISLTRRGSVQVQMVFAERRKHTASYRTPYGTILLGIDTRRIAVTETDGAMQICIDYALEMNGEFVSDCEIVIKIRPRSAENATTD